MIRAFARTSQDAGRVTLRQHSPPVLTWGAVGGTTAGQLLQVAYTVDRPGVTTARLVFAGGRELVMQVLADRLEVLVPADTPAGTATVTAELADEYANTATATLPVLLQGAAPPAASSPPRVPAARRRPQQRLVRSPMRVRITVGEGRVSGERQRRAPAITVTVAVGAGAVRARTPPSARARVELAVRVAVGAARVTGTATLRSRAGLRVGVGETAVLRHDGPELEEALLLGLL